MAFGENYFVCDKRAVWAYDEWNHMRYYDSIAECSKDLDVPPYAISKCCQGVCKSSYGYRFEYYKSDREIDQLGEFRRHSIEKYRRRKKSVGELSRPIIAVDIATKKYRLYNSFSSMCKELMVDERNAYRCLSHSKYYKSVGGYSFWRENEVDLSELEGPF